MNIQAYFAIYCANGNDLSSPGIYSLRLDFQDPNNPQELDVLPVRIGVPFHHICLLVRDVEKMAENFARTFGIGPFVAAPYEAPASKAMVRGRPQGYKLKFANAKIGPITLELVEPVEGNSALTEFLKERGEGLHHLAYCCPPPIDEELAKWKKLGIDALQVDKSISDDPRYGWAYMDTEKLVGCILEIMCLPP